MLKEEILKTWLNVSFTCSEVINRQENNSHLSLRASVLKLNTQQKSAVTRLLWLDPVALTEPQMDSGWLNWSLVKVLHFVHHLPPCDSDGNINAAQVSQVRSGRWSGRSRMAAERARRRKPDDSSRNLGSDSPPDSSLSRRVTDHLLRHAYSFISSLSPPPSIFSPLHSDELHIVTLLHLRRCHPEKHTYQHNDTKIHLTFLQMFK